jgi:NOL1/NOP2/fmu family ribosome biogenesis protein
VLSVIYSGVAMGQIFKGVLKPDGALAFYVDLSREAVPAVEVEEDVALQFLRRQDIAAEPFEQGVNLVVCRGRALGFVKRIGARVNNLYPQSLRILR